MSRVLTAAGISLALAGDARAQFRAGPQFQVNDYTTETQANPALAIARDGRFQAVWASWGQDGDYAGVFLRPFGSRGQPLGPGVQVNQFTTWGQHVRDAGSDDRGNFVVVWDQSRSGPVLGAIMGRRYAADGTPRGPVFRVDTSPPSDPGGAAVAVRPDGSFVVAWEGDDGSAGGVGLRRFDRAGEPLGAEFIVNTTTYSQQSRPHVAVLRGGGFVVVWDSWELPGNAIRARRFAADGTPLGPDSVIANGQYVYSPAVAGRDDGGFVIAWEYAHGSHDVMLRRFDAAGTPVGAEFMAGTSTSFGDFLRPRLAVSDGAQFVVLWSQSALFTSPVAVNARRFGSDGTARGPEFQVNATMGDALGEAVVAADAAGNFVVAWTDRGGAYGAVMDVYAQRFGGLVPAALTADTAADGDSDGNRVLEPGETVDLQPAWRNDAGAPQSFTGALSALTGPPGPSYTITDGAGSYGAVADGATSACADCYAIAVSAPAVRPALHWDVSAHEALLPAVQGQRKSWRLHVGDSFEDVPRGGAFYRFVEVLLHLEVTVGCGSGRFCPAAPVSREQMAVVLLSGREGPGYMPAACRPPNVFSDVLETSPFCRWIEDLAARGVAAGCGGGNYCPSQAVTREQMAVFALRTLDPALDPPACTTPVFADVPAVSPYCRWIEELARRGVVGGCGGGNYCPAEPVTREQMGVFVSVTFGLGLYGP